MPTVSVIVPNYCHAPYLEQRIESILQQTFQDFELILLDDCSTDGSREILERYRNHPKVSGIFYNERNSGSPFKQWEKGLSKSKGDYVWIAESDDFSSPCFLERCVRILDTRPDCSIVFTSSYIVDSHSRTIREEAPVKYPKHKQIRFGSRFLLYRFLCPRNTIYNAGMALVRRSALPADDNYTQYRYCGDWLFWIQIVSGGGNVVYLAEPLNYYRVHDSNTCYFKHREQPNKLLFRLSIWNKLRILKRRINRRKDGHKQEFLDAVKKGCHDGLTFYPKIEYLPL